MGTTYEETCDNCGNATRTIKAGISKHTGKRYDAFEVCDKCNPPKSQQKSQQKPQENSQFLFDEIQGLHKRFDALARYLKEEFDKLNEK